MRESKARVSSSVPPKLTGKVSPHFRSLQLKRGHFGEESLGCVIRRCLHISVRQATIILLSHPPKLLPTSYCRSKYAIQAILSETIHDVQQRTKRERHYFAQRSLLWLLLTASFWIESWNYSTVLALLPMHVVYWTTHGNLIGMPRHRPISKKRFWHGPRIDE